uniref:Prenyltransferase alpha-alpha toroid domain-containing protein n=1 Tax=Bubo bubo TaxID=30461 RepID=A0A8C0I7G6_BUBBB
MVLPVTGSGREPDEPLGWGRSLPRPGPCFAKDRAAFQSSPWSLFLYFSPALTPLSSMLWPPQALSTVASARGSCPLSAGLSCLPALCLSCLSSRFILQREKHFHYLKRGLRQLTEAYEVPVLPAALLGVLPQSCRLCPPAGANPEAFGVIDRELVPWLRVPVYRRSAYCAASVASLTNILTPVLFAGTAEWIARCQNWEGGIGGVAGMEHWVTGRQMRFEGGFQGRCNKLVDGCYSFWQAGLLPLLHRALHARGDAALSMTHWMFDQSALQEYILLCCQCPAGGLLDKPGKSRDFYHTCYCLSGLAIAQHFGSGDLHHETVLGVPENRLQATHPVYNIAPEKVVRAVMHFLQQPVPSLRTAAAAN